MIIDRTGGAITYLKKDFELHAQNTILQYLEKSTRYIQGNLNNKGTLVYFLF